MMSFKNYLFFLSMIVCIKVCSGVPENATVNEADKKPNNKPTSCSDALVNETNILTSCENPETCWDVAISMDGSDYDAQKGVVRRYIDYLKHFQFFIAKILGKADWCKSIESKCFDRLRMLGFDNEYFSDLTNNPRSATKYNEKFAKEHFSTEESIQAIPYKDECVIDYIRKIQKQETHKIKINVLYHCKRYCVEKLKAVGYVFESEQNELKNSENTLLKFTKKDDYEKTVYGFNKNKGLNNESSQNETFTTGDEKNNDVCAVQFKNTINTTDYVGEVPVYDLDAWCEYFCV